MFKLVRRSAEFGVPERGRIALTLVLALIVASFGAAEPLLTKLFFDELSTGRSVQMLGMSLGGLLLVELARTGLQGWMDVTLWSVRVRMDFRVRERLFDRLCTLPVAYHRRNQVGATVNRINQSVSNFLDGFIQVSSSLLPSVVFLVLSVIAMFKLDWRLSLLVGVFVPAPALIGAWAAREQAVRERILMNRWASIYGRLHETLAGILTVKGFARERQEVDAFLQRTAKANRIVLKGVRRDASTNAARNLAAGLARLSAVGLGGYLVLQGEMTIGTLVAFLGYISGLFGPVQGITGAYQTVRRGVVSLEQIYEILDAEDEVSDKPGARDAGRFIGSVSFRNVAFGYGRDRNVIEGFSLDVAPGETVALVGPSGSGKTTLINLLQRQYEVTGGSIEIDDLDVRAYSRTSLRRQIGVVFQDVHLFDDTIHANIAFGCPEATREQVEAAARAANAHEFIMALPRGYDTRVGERGSRLSGGQKQRIAIARALLIDPPILILDEATSALDVESEAQIQGALANLVRGRTTFVIAHRLSTVMNADRIVVLRDGRIESVGTHAELMEEQGYYFYLVGLQANGILADPEEAYTLAA